LTPRGDGIPCAKNSKGKYTLQVLREIDLKHTDDLCRRIVEMLQWTAQRVWRITNSVDKRIYVDEDGKLGW
jgi:hypothetical protein